jgi:hypothetical protein
VLVEALFQTLYACRVKLNVCMRMLSGGLGLKQTQMSVSQLECNDFSDKSLPQYIFEIL